MPDVLAPLALNDKGQCPACARKPIEYKGSWRSTRQFFCVKCGRSYDHETGDQRENFEFKKVEGGFVMNYESRCGDN